MTEMAQQVDNSSFLSGSNAGFIEDLYLRYQNDPSSVDVSWQQYFQTLGDDADTIVNESKGAPWTPANGTAPDDEYGILGDAAYRAIEKAETKGLPQQDIREAAVDTIRALMLIRSYRVRGHLKATLDPLGLEVPQEHPELDPRTYGFAEDDWDREIFLDNVLGLETATIREILDIVQRTYCSSIGVEFMHIQEPDQKAWIQERIEGRHKEVTFTDEGKIAILRKLIETEGFELEASYAMESGLYFDLNTNLSRGTEFQPGDATTAWRGVAADNLQFTVGKKFGDELDLSWEVVADKRFDDGVNVVPGFGVHNLRATYKPQHGVLEGTEIRVGVENVFDKQYTRRLSTRPASGRSLKVSLAATF